MLDDPGRVVDENKKNDEPDLVVDNAIDMDGIFVFTVVRVSGDNQYPPYSISYFIGLSLFPQ